MGWQELLTTDWRKAFPFYSELFGWREAETQTDAAMTVSVTYPVRATGIATTTTFAQLS